MDPRREDDAARRLNRLAAAQIASTGIVVLLVAAVAVIQNGQSRRTAERLDQRITELASQVAALESAPPAISERPVKSAPPRETPEAPQRPVAKPPAPVVPPKSDPPAVAAPKPSELGSRALTLRAQVGDLRAAPAHSAEVLALLKALRDANDAGVPGEAALAAAELAFAVGQIDDCIRLSTVAATHESADRPATYLLAVAQAREGRFDPALAAANKAVEVADCPPRRLWLLATVQEELGLADDAEATLQKLLVAPQTARDPELLADAAAKSGMMALRRGDVSKAGGLHALAEAVRPDTLPVRALGARLMLATGKTEEGVSALRALVAADPGNRELLDAMGEGLMKVNRAGEALEPLRRSAELDPKDAAAQDHVGLALLALLKPTEAAAAFERAIALDGNNATYWYHLGAARINSDACADALVALDAAILRDASLARAYFAKAICLARGGKSEQAADALTRALGLDGGLIDEARNVQAFTSILADDRQAGGTGAPSP